VAQSSHNFFIFLVKKRINMGGIIVFFTSISIIYLTKRLLEVFNLKWAQNLVSNLLGF